MNSSTLSLNSVELSVNLGWPKEERARKQVVKLDVTIHFMDSPKACDSDDIADTYCYREMIETLRDKLSGKHFHLIEHLTQEVHRTLKSMLPENSRIHVSLTKHPQIQGLGGVTFHYFEYQEA